MNTLILVPAILALYLPCCLSGFTNPCFFTKCSSTTECRLRKVNCFTTPCYPTSACLPKTLSKGECKIGKPVVDFNGDDLVCSSKDGSVCPAATFCNKGSCCFGQQVIVKPGNCPKYTKIGCGAVCATDGDCDGSMKCCEREHCKGRTCINPYLKG